MGMIRTGLFGTTQSAPMEPKKPRSTLHSDLVTIAAQWVTDRTVCTRKYGFSCAYAVKELVTSNYAIFDVFGFSAHDTTTMIEVKTSHIDFLRDKKKWYYKSDRDKFVADYNLYFCPDDIIKPEELPEKWGLIYYNLETKNKNVVKMPVRCDNNEIEHCYERTIVRSLFRRLIQPRGVIEVPKEVKVMKICKEPNGE